MDSSEFDNLVNNIKSNTKTNKDKTNSSNELKNQIEKEFIDKILKEGSETETKNEKDSKEIDINLLITDLGQILKKTNNTDKFNYNLLNSIEFN